LTLLTTAGGGSPILTPEQVQTLVVEPLTRLAVATRISTVVTIDTNTTRFPVVISDASSGWTAEGAEINVSDPDLDELEVTAMKLAALVVLSNELIADTNPSALAVVGDSIVRDLAIKLDRAFFGNTVSNGPSGLDSLVGVQHVDGGMSGFTNLDAFAAAQSKLEQVDSSLARSFVAHPNTLLQLSELKIGTDWNLPLLRPDATSPTKRSILGVQTFWSPYVEEGLVGHRAPCVGPRWSHCRHVRCRPSQRLELGRHVRALQLGAGRRSLPPALLAAAIRAAQRSSDDDDAHRERSNRK
jgi:HK97 family phage major capsid protein